MENEPISVLVVEDDFLIRCAMVDFFEDVGFKTGQALNADEAVLILSADRNIDAIFSDIEMPGSMDGLELMEIVRKRWPYVSILVASGRDTPVDSLLDGERFFSKPYAHEAVAQAVSEMVSAVRVCKA